MRSSCLLSTISSFMSQQCVLVENNNILHDKTGLHYPNKPHLLNYLLIVFIYTVLTYLLILYIYYKLDKVNRDRKITGVKCFWWKDPMKCEPLTLVFRTISVPVCNCVNLKLRSNNWIGFVLKYTKPAIQVRVMNEKIFRKLLKTNFVIVQLSNSCCRLYDH